VVKEIKSAVGAGFREVILSGVHLGLYGQDFRRNQKSKIKNQSDNAKCKIDLVGLLRKIIKIKDLGRVRISSIEATEVNDELIKLIASTDKICKHLHIPLQAGCNKILKLMNRPYSTQYFKSKIDKIRKTMPDIAITTDVIVGFPGETKLDFNKTYDFCKEMEFSKIHVFSFSEHEKTPASKMTGKVERREIEARSKKLRELSYKLEKKFKDKFMGKELAVVVEGKEKNGRLEGKTEYYFNIEFDKAKFGEKKIGRIIKIKDWR
jgi:threonylcarbamoyladenosine tRNA methylthiotransferase MtaB